MAGPFTCKLCGATGAISLPDDIATREVRCAGCGRAQPVNDYASGAQQLIEESARLQNAKAERETKIRQGIVCSGCGGTMALPNDPTVEAFPCPYCGRQHTVTEFLDPKLIANQRLRADLGARIDQARTAGKSRDRLIGLLVVGLIVVAALVFAAIRLTGR